MMPLRRSCREVAAILVAREDRRLRFADRIALRLHLAACEACPKFERQILMMRSHMKQWRNYVANEDAGIK